MEGKSDDNRGGNTESSAHNAMKCLLDGYARGPVTSPL